MGCSDRKGGGALAVKIVLDFLSLAAIATAFSVMRFGLTPSVSDLLTAPPTGSPSNSVTATETATDNAPKNLPECLNRGERWFAYNAYDPRGQCHRELQSDSSRYCSAVNICEARGSSDRWRAECPSSGDSVYYCPLEPCDDPDRQLDGTTLCVVIESRAGRKILQQRPRRRGSRGGEADSMETFTALPKALSILEEAGGTASGAVEDYKEIEGCLVSSDIRNTDACGVVYLFSGVALITAGIDLILHFIELVMLCNDDEGHTCCNSFNRGLSIVSEALLLALGLYAFSYYIGVASEPPPEDYYFSEHVEALDKADVSQMTLAYATLTAAILKACQIIINVKQIITDRNQQSSQSRQAQYAVRHGGK